MVVSLKIHISKIDFSTFFIWRLKLNKYFFLGIGNCGELIRKGKPKKRESSLEASASSSTDSSSSESSTSSEEEKKKKKKKKKEKKNKKKSKKKKKKKNKESSAEDNKTTDHPLTSVTNIDPDEIPDVPSNR